ncbi:putative Transcriptional Coactivator p15 (PC4) [Blattamonas nauphoetae]|uniref:Transcriptional Coactivator p15 (PC4) n=1 Tax=Blattamonas nauphoetae TaxID=2049346 RepID=A0ABQ9Y4N9_9EUKA|nr:putative Transcriptional Coactivator p15 (PC4) [Blattamonas nauphoetae]
MSSGDLDQFISTKKRSRSGEDPVGDKSSSERSKPTEWNLGNNRKITISTFKGKAYIDIREYYQDDEGELKPGRKGISLKKEQWDLLLGFADQISEAYEEKA